MNLTKTKWLQVTQILGEFKRTIVLDTSKICGVSGAWDAGSEHSVIHIGDKEFKVAEDFNQLFERILALEYE